VPEYNIRELGPKKLFLSRLCGSAPCCQANNLKRKGPLEVKKTPAVRMLCTQCHAHFEKQNKILHTAFLDGLGI